MRFQETIRSEKRSVPSSRRRVAARLIFLMLALLLSAGCGTVFPSGRDNVEVTAIYAAVSPEIDGGLGDDVWRLAPAYTFTSFNEKCRWNGTVQFAWDEQFVYVGARLDDDDVMALSGKDQDHLYASGDLLEIFLKPMTDSWYWEIYANPLNARASFFVPSGGRILPGDFDRQEHLMKDLKVGVKIDGTINDWNDRDRGWTVEMAIPVEELTRYGAELKAGSVWRFMIGRYNFSRWMDERELSGITRFKEGSRSFHHQPSFGYITFSGGEAAAD